MIMHNIKKSIIILSSLLFILVLFYVSSADPKFGWPLNLPEFLTATLGETRGSYFHQGIDIKTNGRAGYPVFAAADGNVSRIISRDNGYGNALFLDHGDNFKTVYGHLDAFEQKKHQLNDITGILKNLYGTDSIDFSLTASGFIYKKDEMIAYAGESGSGYPHLHFEIREGEKYSNPLDYIHVKDKDQPVISGLWICAERDNATVFEQRINVIRKRGDYTTSAPVRISKIPDGKVFLKISCYDNIGSYNKLGVYRLQVFEENEKRLEFAFDHLNPEDIYLSSLIYDRSKSSIKDGVSYAYNLRRQDTNNFSGFKTPGKGYLTLSKEKNDIKILVSDFAGNEASLKFRIIADNDILINSEDYTGIDDKKNNKIQNINEDITITVPAGAPGMNSLIRLDESMDAEFREMLHKEYGIVKENILKIFSIFPHDAVYKKSFQIMLKHKDKLPEEDAARISIYQFFEGKKPSLLKTSYSSLFREFLAESGLNGYFALIRDIAPPSISIPPTFQFCEDRDIYRKLRFFVKDDLSRVSMETTECYIDGDKFPVKFDPDRNWIEVKLARDYLTKGLHHVLISAFDNAGNRSVFRDLVMF
jgi:hypothetical protein